MILGSLRRASLLGNLRPPAWAGALAAALLASGMSRFPAVAGEEPCLVESVPIEKVWAGHPVRFAIETVGTRQYVAYWDAGRRMSVAARDLGARSWELRKLPPVMGWDSHSHLALAVDGEGYIHLSGNMHNDPLVYFRSVAPHDISRFERLSMVGGRKEKRVSYPRFLRDRRDNLYFLYRHGRSGKGEQIVNRYDSATRQWERLLAGPLLDGEGRRSAYPVGPFLGPDGYFHLVWMWRDSADGNTNHDLSYARSTDLVRWESAGGRSFELPITLADRTAVVDPIPSGHGLVTISFGAGWDSAHRPILYYSKYDAGGSSQAYNARWEGEAWRVVAASDWDYRWPIDRTGTLDPEITIRPPRAEGEGLLRQEFDHIRAGHGVWILDEATLEVVDVEETPATLAELLTPLSATSGMEVREPEFDRTGEYFLHWETLPARQDEALEGAEPEPSLLRVQRILGGPESLLRGCGAGEGSPELPIVTSRAAGTSVDPELPNPLAPAPASPAEAGVVDLGTVVGQVLQTRDEAEAAEPQSLDAEVEGVGIAGREREPLPEAPGAQIRTIRIFPGDIFDESDPVESKRVYRWVNRLHSTTRERVIRRQLLFQPGDAYDPRLLEESERLLRGNRYLHDAHITAVVADEDVVDVDVRTRDVWTLSGGAGFGRAGGENDYQIKVEDFNVLGTGKEVALRHTSNVDRRTTELDYRDDLVAGSRFQLELNLDENSDGHRRVIHLRRPFFALDTRWSTGFTAISDERIDRLFDGGTEIDRFERKSELFQGFWGFSPGLLEGMTRRWKLGFTYSRDDFAAVGGDDRPTALPPDRKLSYPWIDLEIVQDRFVVGNDLEKLSRSEDLRIGRGFHGVLGWSSPTFGGDKDLALFVLSGDIGHRPGPRKLLLTGANAGGRWGRDGWEALLMGVSSRFYWRNWGQHLFYARAEFVAAPYQDADQQLLLGGETGLRGYPLRFQTGDRRFLLTLEQRFFTGWEPFRIANVGAAVFLDIGRAWFAGVDAPDDLGVLTDIGFGLRVSPSRSGRGTVVHFDVAFPLDAPASIESVQWLITTKETL